MTTKLTTSNLSAETLTAISGPRISNVKIADSSYNTLDDTAANISGGFIIINGQNFISNCQVLIDNTPATTVTFVSNSVIRAQVPASAEGTTKSIYVVNPDGSSAIIINGLTYSAFPAWSTGSTLTSFEALVPVSIQLSAPSATVYTLAAANTLPSSLSLYANGLIAGTVAANTTTNYNFTVNAKDAENQDTNRNFTLPITQNIEPAWVTAADLGSAFVDANYSNTLVATDLSNITYSVAAGSSLPSTLTLAANGLLSGNVSAANTYSFGIVATDTANLSNTRTFSITITVASDTYFKNTTLLLNGETTVTPFISDASTNSFPLTINGDTKPVLFNPYQEGYYSNFFDGTGDYLYTSASSANAMGTGDYTVEAWIYVTAAFGTTGSGRGAIISNRGQESATSAFMLQHYNGKIYFGTSNIDVIVGNTTLSTNTWYHVVVSRSSGTVRLFLNGVSDATAVTGNSTNHSATNAFYVGIDGAYGAYPFTGYISNARLVKGTAVYTSAFTSPTTPLTAIANTSLLTCQSNRFIDNSTNAFTITKNGDTLVSPNIPFTQNSSYSTYGSTYFDGTGDTLSIPSPTTGFSLSTGDFTIECWVYKSSAVNSVLLDARSSAAGLPWAFVIDGSNFPYWYDNTVYTSTVAVTLNSWSHVAAVRTSGVLKIFVNGVQGYSASYGTNLDRTAGLVIGDTVHAAGPLLGYISNLRIVKGTAVYTTAFTPPTAPLTAIANTQLLTCQYNGGATNQGIIDNSNFNNIVTRAGNTSQGTFSPYSVTGWSNFFDGTGDYLSTPSNSAFSFGTGDFTVEMLINFNTNGQHGIFQISTNPGGFNTSNSNSIAAQRSATGQWEIYAKNSNPQVNATINQNQWYHIAIVRFGTTTTFYVDGVVLITVSADTTNYTGTYMGIGAIYSTAVPLNGSVSNLRVVKGTALYTTTFTPSTTPLTAIANTSLLTCQSNRLIDNSPNSFTLTRNGDVSVQAFGPFGSIPEAVPISYSNFFDGTGDYLSFPNNSAFAFGTGSFTIEFWINAPLSNDKFILSGRAAISSLHITTGGYNGTTTAGALRYGSTDIGTSVVVCDNTWHHCAIVRDGSSAVTMYVDGVSRATTTDSTNYTTTAGTWYIATNDSGPPQGVLTGYISNLRIIKGTAVYTTTFTPSTTPLTAIANTSLLTCQSTRMIDNSTNAFTITDAGDVKPRIFNPFGYTAQTYTNYTPSLHGGSAYFDGTTDYLSIPSNVTQFTFGTGDFTIEFWLYLNSTGQQIIWDGRPGSAAPTIYYYNSALRYYTNAADRIVGSSLSTGQWYHIALCRSSTSTKMFINGTQTGSTYSDSTTYTTSTPIIGADANAGNYTLGLNGYLSDIRITKGTAIYTSNFVPPAQALTNYSVTNPASLLLNFNNGGIIDQHGTNVLETLGNAQLSTAIKKYNNASMYFDGTGDYLYSPPNLNYAMGSGDFTIEFWYYPVTHTNTNPNIMGNYNATWTSNKWAFHAPHSTAAGKYSFWVNNIVTQPLLASTSNVTNGAWVYLTITRSGSTWRMFVNGTIEATATSSAALDGGTAASMDGFYVGANFYSGEGGRYINAYIDDLRITKGVARYTTTFTPPTTALIAK